MINVASNLSKFLPKTSSTKFGVSSDPEKERDTCKLIHVFMANHGYTATEKKRLVMLPTTTLKEAKKNFGKNAGPYISDENDFAFHEDDLERPLWVFSNECKLNLNFTQDHLENIKNVSPFNTKKV